MPLYAQDVQNVSQKTDTTIVAPIESSRLQGTREATEAEKEYARRLSEAREEQRQIDNNLPMVVKPLRPTTLIIPIGIMVGRQDHGDCTRD